MKTLLKVSVIVIMPLFMLMADIPFLMVDLVPDANAVLGVRRRALRRGVIIGEAAAGSAASTSASAEATAQQQSATAQQQATATPNPSPSGATLPMGTVVHTLPSDCLPKAIGGVEYYFCGGNYYRTAFQGSNLVYVTSNPQ